MVSVVVEFCADLMHGVAEFLGKAELRLLEVYEQHLNTNGALTKKLILHQVESGEIVVKVDLQMFTKSY